MADVRVTVTTVDLLDGNKVRVRGFRSDRLDADGKPMDLEAVVDGPEPSPSNSPERRAFLQAALLAL